MAREDLFSKLALKLTQKMDPPTTDDNTILFKIVGVQDTLTQTDAVTAAKAVTANEVWGGTGYTPGWLWGYGIWL